MAYPAVRREDTESGSAAVAGAPATIPIRTLRIHCEAERPVAFSARGTLEPYGVMRGLIGAAITASSRELERALFKLPPLRESGSVDESEAPGTPWRLRLSHLYAREVKARFEIVIDLFGEEPCDLAGELIAAVRLAGSGGSYRDWRTGRQRRWGIDLAARGARKESAVPFDVIDIDMTPARCLADLVGDMSGLWRYATEAHLVFRTLTVLTVHRGDRVKGHPLGVTGDIDAPSLIGNALRRLVLLEVATRRDHAERKRCHLREVLAQKDRVLAAVAAAFPLNCLDAVTVPLECDVPGRKMRGLIGSARMTTADFEPWLAGVAACELLGVGEGTAYGAGQVAWAPARSNVDGEF